MIEDLPLNGRGVLSLTALSAGVTPQAFNRGTQFGAAGSSRNQYVTVEGGRDSSTNYAIDGVYVRSLRFNNLSLNPPLDAVQEVSLLRNSFSTEYGQGQAVVSIVTKSGTNRVSGSVYDFVRNDKFDARNYFAAAKTPFERNQYGFTTGGPVLRNKILRLRWLRRSSLHAGTDVPGDRSEPCVPDAAIFRVSPRRSSIRSPGCRFPGIEFRRVASRNSRKHSDPRCRRPTIQARATTAWSRTSSTTPIRRPCVPTRC